MMEGGHGWMETTSPLWFAKGLIELTMIMVRTLRPPVCGHCDHIPFSSSSSLSGIECE